MLIVPELEKEARILSSSWETRKVIFGFVISKSVNKVLLYDLDYEFLHICHE